jgi:hypothetical protein
MTINGSCFCGKSKYKIEGKLRDATACHCSMCRKMFNSPASAYALLEPSEFSWLMDENLLSTYKVDEDFGLNFCSECGSTLGGVYKGHFKNNEFQEGKLSWVTLGCIEGDPGIEIGKHIFVGSKAAWEVMPEGVDKYEEWPT